MIEAARTTAMLFFILIGAIMFSYFIVQTQIATNLAAWVVSLHLPPTAVMVVVALFYIVLGSFLESLTMILITVPVFAPLAQSIGYDLVWFGVLLVVLIEVGLIHPPMGMNLFVLQSQLPDAKIGKMYVGSAMFLLANAVLIALLIAYPQIALGFHTSSTDERAVVSFITCGVRLRCYYTEHAAVAYVGSETVGARGNATKRH